MVGIESTSCDFSSNGNLHDKVLFYNRQSEFRHVFIPTYRIPIDFSEAISILKTLEFVVMST